MIFNIIGYPGSGKSFFIKNKSPHFLSFTSFLLSYSSYTHNYWRSVLNTSNQFKQSFMMNELLKIEGWDTLMSKVWILLTQSVWAWAILCLWSRWCCSKWRLWEIEEYIFILYLATISFTLRLHAASGRSHLHTSQIYHLQSDSVRSQLHLWWIPSFSPQDMRTQTWQRAQTLWHYWD